MNESKEEMSKSLIAEAPTERLRTFGDPVLKEQTRPVTEFDAALEALVKTMFAVMEREDGVGLAAPQIGVLKRVAVWRHPENENERYVLVNPRIVERSEACSVGSEGCLSVPEVTVDVERPDEVVVEAQDVTGSIYQMHLTGLLARIVQHEIDHLDGCLILDRASAEERRRVLRALRERSLASQP